MSVCSYSPPKILGPTGLKFSGVDGGHIRMVLDEFGQGLGLGYNLALPVGLGCFLFSFFIISNLEISFGGLY